MNDRLNELNGRMTLLRNTDRCGVFLQSLDSVYLDIYQHRSCLTPFSS
jgi:hypothetical protein